MPRLSKAEPVFPAEAGTLTRIFMERTSYRPNPIAPAKINLTPRRSDAQPFLRVRPHGLAQLADDGGLQVRTRLGLLVPLLIGLQRESVPELREDATERLRD